MYFVRERAFANELVKRFNNYFKRYQNVSFFILQNVSSISFSYKKSENPFRKIGKFFHTGINFHELNIEIFHKINFPAFMQKIKYFS